MRKYFALFMAVMLLCVMVSGACAATSFDFVAFAKQKVLTDFHPTANPSNAVAEYDEKPFEKEAGILRARVIMNYKGWWRRHEMLVEMELKESNNTIKVSVLRDSNGMNLLGNSIFKEDQWVSLSSIGWK